MQILSLFLCTLQHVCTVSTHSFTDCVNTALPHCNIQKTQSGQTLKRIKGFTLLKCIMFLLSSECCTYLFIFIILFLKSLPYCRYDCRFKTSCDCHVQFLSLAVIVTLPYQCMAVQPWHAVLTLILKARLHCRQVFDVRGAQCSSQRRSKMSGKANKIGADWQLGGSRKPLRKMSLSINLVVRPK